MRELRLPSIGRNVPVRRGSILKLAPRVSLSNQAERLPRLGPSMTTEAVSYTSYKVIPALGGGL